MPCVKAEAAPRGASDAATRKYEVEVRSDWYTSANLLSRPTPSAFGVGQKNALRVTKLTSTNLTQGNPGWIRARRLTSLNAIGLWLIHLLASGSHTWPEATVAQSKHT
jgi:hypothetical protein